MVVEHSGIDENTLFFLNNNISIKDLYKVVRTIGRHYYASSNFLKFLNYRVSHKEVQVFDEDFLNMQKKKFKNNLLNRIEERST